MISIIVPIYNVEKYISKCVNSILNQTYKDLEIILVDDGSSDNCSEICDAFAEKDSRIKVVHKENGGLMSARQAGLREATAEYVGFVDGDDWIEQDMYMHFYNAVEKYKPDMVASEFYFDYGNELIVSRQNLSKPYFEKAELISEIYPEMLFKPPYYNFGINPCCWSKIYKKELLEGCLYTIPKEIKMGEDAAFTYPCLIHAQSLAYIDKPCYHYIDNPNSITSSYDENMENTILIPYDILKKEFLKTEYNYLNSLEYYLIYLVNFIIRNEASIANSKSAKSVRKILKKFVNNADVHSAAEKISLSPLPIHTKFIVMFLRMKSTFLIYLYTVLFRRFYG